MFSMHTAHLANVSKSVTKNATFSRTGGLPCLITHSCMSAASPTVVGGLIFCISATPQPGCLFPLFHGYKTNIFRGEDKTVDCGTVRGWDERKMRVISLKPSMS